MAKEVKAKGVGGGPPAEAAATTPKKALAGEMMEISDMADHARKKGMWAGAIDRVDIPGLLGAWEVEEKIEDEKKEPVKHIKIAPITSPHTPAMLKIVDEIVVNASDHERQCRANKKADRVTYITVDFDKETGRIVIENDGPGIFVEPHKKATELHAAKKGAKPRTIYNPEVSFGWFLAGTNIDKDLTNVKGGTNGLGAKIACVHCARLHLETVDRLGRYYSQEFRDRLRPPIDPPTVYPTGAPALSKDQRKPHTRVEMLPAYKELHYVVTARAGKDPALNDTDASELDAWIRLRTYQLAAYVGASVRVAYNGETCPTNSAEALAKLMCESLANGNGEDAPQATIIPIAVKPTVPRAKEGETKAEKATREEAEFYKPHPWDVSVVVLPPGVKGGKGVSHMAIVNGVVCNKGGHIAHLRQLLSDATIAKIESITKPARGKGKKSKAAPAAGEKKLGMADTMANVRIVMCGALPGADWGGQRKDELQVPKRIVNHYQIKPTDLKNIASIISDRLLAATSGNSNRGGPIDDYRRAAKAGGPQAALAALFGAEGLSALGMLHDGFAQNSKAKREPGADPRYLLPSFEWCGTISLGGVVINAMKDTKEIETSSGETLLVRSERLRKNVRLQNLVNAMGLDYSKSYATAAEKATLKYGRFYIAVDQDLDGIGKIASLVLVFFHLYWPNLIKDGHIGRFITPVVRMYPKRAAKAPAKPRGKGAKKVIEEKKADLGPALKEFHYEEEFRVFLEANPNWEADYKKPVYYKGLAAHEDDEVRRMFKPDKFNRSLYLFTLEDSDKELFKIYFGGDADGAANRRGVLRTPVQYLTYEEAQELHRLRLIPCRIHLNVDTKAFKLEAVERQIPHAVDGLVPSARKIAAGCRVVLGASKEGKKLYQVSGPVASLMAYHHGDASLNGTMTRMAQRYPGACQYPLLVGHGRLGTRHLAGKDAGSERYVGVSLSPIMKAVFPDADMPLLPYVFEDGQRAEPRYFIPVVPLAVLEKGGSRPSEGWNHESSARDYASVMKVLDILLSDTARGGILRKAADEVHERGAIPEVVQKIKALEGLCPLPISTRDFGGTIRPYNGSPHSFGVYDYDAKTRTIHVTELPIGMPTGGNEKCPGFIGGLGKGIRAELIESCANRSGAETVDLSIKLKPGAYERIQAESGGDFIDPIESFLQLYESAASKLNYVGTQGTVLEFGQSYLAALLYWFPIRRDLYRMRLYREAVLLELRILELENIVRYSQVYDELGLKALDDEAATALLSEREFPLLDNGPLHSPGFTPADELRQLIVEGPKISHNYLLDLTDRGKLAPRVAKKQADLEKLREELKTYQAALGEKPFPGISVWRREIAEFEAQVKRGIATHWLFRKSRDEDDGENGEE